MPNVLGEKTAILQEARLSSALGHVLRRLVKFLVTRFTRKVAPIEFNRGKPLVDACGVDATFAQLGCDTPRPIAATGALRDICFSETPVILQAFRS